MFGQNAAARDAAIEMIQAITAEAEIGEIYTGTVARIVDFRGPLSRSCPERTASCASRRLPTSALRTSLTICPKVRKFRVKVLDVDQRGRIKLSMREVAAESAEAD